MARARAGAGARAGPGPLAADGEPGDAAVRKNREQFDDAGDPHWDACVYQPLHDGWRFTSIAGRPLLDRFAARADLRPGKRLIDPCCGLGDVARYLAASTGVDVLGLDINARQVEHARSNLARRNPELVDRVRFASGDVRDLAGLGGFDGAVVLDSLMYVPDRLRGLDRLAGALRPGGRLLLAEVLAGPRYDTSTRDRLWRLEGIVDLPTPTEQAEQLRLCGFDGLETQERPEAAVAAVRTICAASVANADLLGALGERRAAAWMAVNRMFLALFEARVLTYAWFQAGR